ncbi:MAG: nitrous oxide reductase accessory protein NosL [Flavobacteriaceae bacterium]|jgi:copper chaperone NosL|nr:nitrous oxide reductase accessory protein NosL [Flavobacteriaceae bacterium]MCB0485441.1 nitrous oxide reductase accessory protein NosL [Flavobacteriaceae bacterium]
MKAKFFIMLWGVLILNTSCSIEPKKIEYGSDACHYCKMTIVDQQHAAEIVTKKGKAFKYDAIECMMNDMEDKDFNEIGLFLVTDYVTPENLVDATKATYLISKHIQSPMGANLSAFEEQSKVQEFVKDDEDKVFTWEELQKYFYNK